MALSFSLNLSQSNASNNNSVESAGSLASVNNNSESAGSLASAGQTSSLLSSPAQCDEFVSNNPFAPQIDYSQYSNESVASSSCGETAGSLASAGCESAGSLAFSGGGCESAGSVASSGGDSFSSFC